MKVSVPEILNIGNSEKYILSIRLCSDGLSFSGYNSSDRSSFFYGEAEYDRSKPYLLWLKEFFFANEFLSYGYAEVRVLYVTSFYTLVPESVFTKKKGHSLLSFNFSDADLKELDNPLKDCGFVLVFGIPDDLYQFCVRSLITPVFYHHLTPMLSYWGKQSSQALQKLMYVYLRNNSMDIICYAGGNLLFANSFSFQSSTDIIYFILYAWKQNGFDQQTDRLLLHGIPDLRGEIVQLLSSFIHQIEPIGKPSEVYLLDSVSDRISLDLLYLSVCEL